MIIVMFKRPARASRDACWRRLHGSRVRSRAALLLLLLLLLGGLDVLLEVKRSIGIAYTIHECHPKQLLRSIYPRFSPAFASATSHALWLLGPDSASLHARAHPASRPQTSDQRPSSSTTTPIDNPAVNIRYTRLHRRSAIVVVADFAPLFTAFLPSDSNCIDAASTARSRRATWKLCIATDPYTTEGVSANNTIRLVDREQSLQIITQPGCAVAHWLDRTTRSSTAITQNGVNRC
jgi:hypothetical protein